MMITNKCQICGRKLTDSESIARGFGPDCAETRGEFIEACGTTDAEITELESANAQSERWIRNFKMDMRHGRVYQAKQCLDIARRKADSGRIGAAKAVTETGERGKLVNIPATAPTLFVVKIETPRRSFFIFESPYRNESFVSIVKARFSKNSRKWNEGRQCWELSPEIADAVCEVIEREFKCPVLIVDRSVRHPDRSQYLNYQSQSSNHFNQQNFAAKAA